MVYYIVFIIMLIQWVEHTIRDKRIARDFGWKAYKKNYFTFVYGELIDNEWKEIELPRIYHRKRGDFYIDFSDSEQWKSKPYWAQDREKVIQRVLKLFPEHLKTEDDIEDIGK